MSSSVKIDLITFDQERGEYALYLVESGPWSESLIGGRIEKLEARICHALDVALQGLLGTKYPDAIGKPVRVQVDLYDEAPGAVYQLVCKLQKEVAQNDVIQSKIRNSPFLGGLRIVTGEQLGR